MRCMDLLEAAVGHDVPFVSVRSGALDFADHRAGEDAARHRISAGVDFAALRRTGSYTYGNANLNQHPTPARPRRGSTPHRNRFHASDSCPVARVPAANDGTVIG